MEFDKCGSAACGGMNYTPHWSHPPINAPLVAGGQGRTPREMRRMVEVSVFGLASEALVGLWAMLMKGIR